MEPCYQKPRGAYPNSGYRRPLYLTRQQRLRGIRRVLYERDNRCFYCRTWIADFSVSTLDHIQPLAKGGSDSIRNLVLACIPCNRAKGSFSDIHEARAYAQTQKEKRVRGSDRVSRKVAGDTLRTRVPAKHQSSGSEQLQREVVPGDLPNMPPEKAPFTNRELELLSSIVWYQHTMEELREIAKGA